MSDTATILDVLLPLTGTVSVALGGIHINHAYINPHLAGKCTDLVKRAQGILNALIEHRGPPNAVFIQALEKAIAIAKVTIVKWNKELKAHKVSLPWGGPIEDVGKSIEALEKQLVIYEKSGIAAEGAGTEQSSSNNGSRGPHHERERIVSTRHVDPFTAQNPPLDGPTVPQHAHLQDDDLRYPTKSRLPGLRQTLMHGHRGKMAMNQNPSWNNAGDLEAQEQDIGHSYPPSASPIVPRPPSRRHAMGKAARDMQSQGLSTPDNRHGTTLQMPPSQARYDPRMAPNTGGTHYQDPFANPGPPQYSTNNLGPGMVPTTYTHNDPSAAGPSTAGSGWHGNAQRHTYLPPYSETGQPSLPGDGSASQFPQSPTNISRNSGSAQQRWDAQEYDQVESIFNDYHNLDH